VTYLLSDIVARFGGELIGEDIGVDNVATLEAAGATDIVFVGDPKYAKQLAGTGAGAVIVNAASVDLTTLPRILVSNPYLFFARTATLLNPPARPAPGVHPSAVVSDGVTLGEGCHIGPFVTIGAGSEIGANVVLEAGCRVGTDVVVGADSFCHPNVVLCAGTRLGARVIIHPGAVIGSDGFGNAWQGDGWFKIPQLGRVVIGDDVEIGASTTVDRGALGDTVIEDGVRLDNQIQIGHNVHIGKHTAMAGCVGVAGSTRIGAYCTFGGSAMILGHLEIADRVNIMAGTLVGKSIKKAGTYVGQYPVQTHEDWLANASHLRRLDALAGRLKELERKVGPHGTDDKE